VALDLVLTCRLIAQHLKTEGVSAAAVGSQIRIKGGPTFVLRQDAPADDSYPAGLFWVDVDGLDTEPRMSLELCGWGLTAEERATDATQGMLAAIIPPVRWLASPRWPWIAPPPDAGVPVPTTSPDGRPWTIVVGRPWIIVLAYDDAAAADEAAARLKESLVAGWKVTLEGFGDHGRRALDERRAHWFKIFASRSPDGQIGCQLDIDNTISIDSPEYGATIPWHDGRVTQIVRQLVVMRPDAADDDRQPSLLQRMLARH